MTLNVIVRTDDPARTAKILGALGISTNDPNRPNPDAWTVRTTVSLVVTAAEGHKPGVYLGPADFEGALEAVAEIIGTEGISVASNGMSADIDVGDGLALLVERDAPRA